MYFSSATLLNLTLLVLTAASACPGFADEQTVPANQKLKNEQEAVSGRFARFERVLSQMADMLGYEDPERAELLRRAISLGREQGISASLETIAKNLGRSEFGSAVEKQKAVTANLKSLLKLLQSEDRMSSVERERERINNLLKDVNNVLLEERAARARAQNSEAPSSAAPAQQEALKKTDEILDDIQKHDKPSESSSQSESESGDSADGKPSDENSGKPSAGQKEMDAEGQKAGDKETESQESDKPGDSDGTDKDKDAKGEPDKSGSENKSPEEKQSSEESSEGNPSADQPSQSESQSQSQSQSQSEDKPEDKEPQEQTKGKKNLDLARNMMQEALDLLKQQKKEQAVDRQDKAITELQQAANELEKMLNQLREEEKEMVLAALEARFQRLLAMQTQIMDSTTDLASTPRKEWLDNAVSACRVLGQQQTELTRECSYTTSLLREDGTSVSILIAVEDIESDMGNIAERLQQTKADSLTQSMEADVIEALQELVETTQKEMSEMKQQQQQPPSGQQDKPDLVDLMQEIKVLRSLQLRVNRRTRQVNELFQDVVPSDVADLQEQLIELANRQQRLGDSAAELARKMEERQ